MGLKWENGEKQWAAEQMTCKTWQTLYRAPRNGEKGLQLNGEKNQSNRRTVERRKETPAERRNGETECRKNGKAKKYKRRRRGGQSGRRTIKWSTVQLRECMSERTQRWIDKNWKIRIVGPTELHRIKKLAMEGLKWQIHRRREKYRAEMKEERRGQKEKVRKAEI